MAATLWACTLAALALVVTGAPTYMDSEDAQFARQYPEDLHYLRDVRSQLTPHYVLPCAAAAAAAAAATNPMHISNFASPLNMNTPRYAGAQHGFGVPHYRSVDEQMAEAEMLAFSDMDQMQRGQAVMMDHIPMARTNYGLAPSSMTLNGPALTPSSGIAYGVFPNAHVGKCNVPLLFSCSPSISSGHIMEHQAQEPEPPSPTGGSYRLVDVHSASHEHGEEMQPQHFEPAHETSHASHT